MRIVTSTLPDSSDRLPLETTLSTSNGTLVREPAGSGSAATIPMTSAGTSW